MSAETPENGSQVKIAILLSTFNGAKFLAEQLDSILGQSHGNFILIVRDDGSTDTTLEVLRRYQNENPSTIFLLEDNTPNRGPSGSFSLLCEYLLGNKTQFGINRIVACFCDQDDVWAKDKLAIQLEALLSAEREDQNKPVLVHSDLVVVDEALREIAPSLIAYQGLEIERRSFPNLAISNLVTGCTAMFNEDLLTKALPVPKRAIMHDWWFAMTAAAFGELVFIPQALIQYRQHGGNAIGAKQKEHVQEGFFARVLGLEHNEHLVEVAVQAKEFSQRFGGELKFSNWLALFLCRRMRSRSAVMQRVYYRLARKF